MSRERRKLSLRTLEDIVEDAQRVTAADYTTVGTWSAGQIFEHLAVTIDIMLDGTTMKTPLHIRVLGPLVKRFIVKRTMKPGLKLPSWAAEQLIPPDTTVEKGLEHLAKSCRRFGAATQLKVHPIFGSMTKEQAVQLHCRHAELHLSHIVPVQETASQ